MFREIDAECYIMTDGDDTYPAEFAREMADKVLDRHVDMVGVETDFHQHILPKIRDRFIIPNQLVRKSINRLFKKILRIL